MPKETNLGGLLKPVVIDLSPAGSSTKEDGLQFLPLWNSPVFFNSDDDSFRERTAWVGPDEGIVVHDIGNDGKVTSYKEIALSASDEAKDAGATTDMDALLKLYDTGVDKNGNGKIDTGEGKGDKIITAAEADANDLKIWRDADMDGLVDAGEMVTFAEAGISKIDLTDFNAPSLDIDNDGKKDPDVLTRFSDGSTIYNTAKVTMTDGSTTTAYDMGFAHETVGMTEKKNSAGFVTQVTLERNIGISSTNWVYKTADADGEAVSWNFSDAEFDANYGGTGTDGNDKMSFSGSQRRSFSGGEGNDTLTGGAGDDFLIGGTGKDKLSGRGGNDVLYIDADDTETGGLIDGGEGYDVITVNSADGVTLNLNTANAEAFFGNAGNDIITAAGDLLGVIMIGGMGNDRLSGGSGGDILAGGDGDDMVSGGAGDDIVTGGDGRDHVYGGEGDDLVYADEKDNFTYVTGGAGFDVLVIDDSVDRTAVFATALDLADMGFEAAVGGDGNDSFTVTTTEDTFLYGAGGNDTLRTDEGNDLLAGGKGNDFLDGNGGGDLYLFNREEGDDTISEAISVATQGNGGLDVIAFGADIDVDDLQFQRVDTNLVISLRTENKATLSGETIKINGWSSAASQIEVLAFSDGTVLDINGARFTTLDESDDSNASVDAGSLTADVAGATTGANVIDAGYGDDTIHAWAGNDIVLGRWGDDKLYGGDGHDYLNGGYGNDTLYGEKGDDTLIGGKDSAAADSLYGGDGNDTLEGNGGNDTLRGENGEDVVIGGEGNDTVDGGAGDDQLFGGEGNDQLKGGAGDDSYFIQRGGGADTITDAGSDDDSGGINYVPNTAGVDKTGDWIVFGSGITLDDLTFDVSGGDLIIGVGENGDLSKRPIELDDHIVINDWSAGVNRMERFLFSDGFSLDVVDGIGGAWAGDNSTESHRDGDGSRFLSGGGGNDSIVGDHGTDVIIGGAGNDYISGWYEDDYIFGGSGNDHLTGNEGDDRLYGGSGDDVIQGFGDGDGGSTSNDFIVGGGGDDILEGGFGNSVYAFDYAEGTDTIVEAVADTTVDTIQLSAGIWFSDLSFDWDETEGKMRLDLKALNRPDIGVTTIFFTKYSVEQVQFANGYFLHIDHLGGGTIGNENDNTIDNSTYIAGRWIEGNDGADKIYAGSGDDFLYGGRHDDVLKGGAGDDVYIINANDGRDVITDTSGKDSIAFGPGIALTDLAMVLDDGDMYIALRDSRIANFDPRTAENYVKVVNWSTSDDRIDWFDFADGTAFKAGSLTRARHYGSGDDTIEATSDASEWIDAGTGNDLIEADGGNDYVFGRDGNDNLKGGDGNDILYGEKGEDRLYGEDGNDTLIGGEGDDYLKGSGGNNRAYGGEGDDTIIAGSGSNLVAGGKGDDIIYRGGYAQSIDISYSENIGRGDHENWVFREKWDNTPIEDGARLDGKHAALTVVQFAAGDGKDHLITNSDKNQGPGTKDQIDLLGIARDQLWFQKSGDDLVLKILGTEDQLTFDDYYLGAAYGFGRINADGQFLTSDRIDELVNVMKNYTDINDGTDGTGVTVSELPSSVVTQINAQWQWITA